VVNVTDPYGSILGFSRQEPLLFYQVAPQLYSRGCVDPVPDALLYFFLEVPGIELGPPDMSPRILTTRPQRRSAYTLSVANSYVSAQPLHSTTRMLKKWRYIFVKSACKYERHFIYPGLHT
jgi:hypothetical protein